MLFHVSNQFRTYLTRVRTIIRGNEFLLIPIALVIGCFAGFAVALMSWTAQLAHVVIFGIPLDVRLSADLRNQSSHRLDRAGHRRPDPRMDGMVAPAVEDPECHRSGRGQRAPRANMSLRDSLVVSGQTLISNGCGASVGLEAGYTQIGAGQRPCSAAGSICAGNDLRLMVGAAPPARSPPPSTRRSRARSMHARTHRRHLFGRERGADFGGLDLGGFCRRTHERRAIFARSFGDPPSDRSCNPLRWSFWPS